MSNRVAFEMTKKDLNTLLDASKPVPYMIFGGMPPRSPQENANAAWRALGERIGFDYMTVEPVRGMSERFFTAETAEIRAGQ